MLKNKEHRIFHLFADILEYPTPNLLSQVKECMDLLSSVNPQTVTNLDEFNRFVEQAKPGRLDEIYTGTFDLQVVCYPYAGYHLFGESYKRGAFMVKLKERYSANGFSAGSELPDHIAVILRFLALLQDEEERRVLVGECLIPALEKMVRAFGDKANPYGEVTHALLRFLQVSHREMMNKELPSTQGGNEI
jgi:nitrate reductase delta subunit